MSQPQTTRRGPKGDRASDQYNTPPWITEALGWFDLDPCSNKNSTVLARRKFTVEDDGLAQIWSSDIAQTMFINPPYSDPKPWVAKAIHSVENILCGPSNILFLVTFDPTRKWFHDLIDHAAKIHVFKKRLAFHLDGEEQQGNNFASCLIELRTFATRHAPSENVKNLRTKYPDALLNEVTL